MMNLLIPCIRTMIFLTVVIGLIYPLSLTLFGKLFMPYRTQGSLVYDKNVVIGSSLLAQSFKSPRYFWPRPSSSNYQPLGSEGSNLIPTSHKLKEQVEARRKEWAKENPTSEAIPLDLLFASGSGLDPHISVMAAFYQVDRVAKARKVDVAIIRDIVYRHIEKRFLGFLGENQVNVLLLNIALDKEIPLR